MVQIFMNVPRTAFCMAHLFHVCTVAVAAFVTSSGVAAPWQVHAKPEQGRVEILLDGEQFATYVYENPEIPRPYFANVIVPGGIKVTRNHPPAHGDSDDHDKMHTGIWLAFGDLSGQDYWRLKAPIEHVRFVLKPQIDGDVLRFSIENLYLTHDRAAEVCREMCKYEFHRVSDGVLLVQDSEFSSAHDSFYFGDQEEMGLGVRLATPVAVVSGNGGRIFNSEGKVNEAEVWSTSAEWCDYSGPLAGKFVGMTIMPHPDNFRRAWCHARDSGFMAMNPFGRNAFTGGEKSKVVVPAGEEFRLGYGALIHWHDAAEDLDVARGYNAYLQLVVEPASN